MKKAIHLGVNIDHVATLRQARGTVYPEPIYAAFEAAYAGANNITLHLREDRRHIQDDDVRHLKALVPLPMNLELAITPFMLDFAAQIQPEQVCFVPEKREELTTEGGLDAQGQLDLLKDAVNKMHQNHIDVSVFIDPEATQIDAVVASGAKAVELHTGCYADAKNPKLQREELARLSQAAFYAAEKGLIVHAGHGLHYHNVQAVAAIPVLHTLNIGHALIAKAVFSGLKQAVEDMIVLMNGARGSNE